MDCVSSVKYLGVHLDCKLDYSIHTTKTAAKVKKCIGFIFRSCRRVLPPKLLCHLYCSLFRVILLYSCEVSYPVCITNRIQLERVQKYACRLFLSNFDRDTSYTQLCTALNLVPIWHTVFTKRLILMHQYVHSIRHFPRGVFTMVSHSTQRRSARSNHSFAIQIPKSSCKRYSSSPFIVSAVAYNHLAQDCVSLNLNCFKTAVSDPHLRDIILFKTANSSSKIISVIDI